MEIWKSFPSLIGRVGRANAYYYRAILIFTMMLFRDTKDELAKPVKN